MICYPFDSSPQALKPLTFVCVRLQWQKFDLYGANEKSRNMKNLFSSPTQAPDLQKFIIKQLDQLLNEQREQRSDLAQILRILHKNINDSKLQKEVDDYYADNDGGTEQ